MQDALTNILFVLFLCGIVALAVSLFFYYRILTQRAFIEAARQLRFRYYYRSYAIPRRFAFLNQHRRGRGRYASNIFLGRHAGVEVVVFDYRFNKGLGPDKKWHFSSFSVMHHGCRCPFVRIYPRSMLAVLGEIVGYEELALDGHELAAFFSVFTNDHTYARSLLATPVVHYLLHHPEESLEIDPDWLAIGSPNMLFPEGIPQRLKQLEKVRGILPL